MPPRFMWASGLSGLSSSDRLNELLKKLEDNFGWKPIHPKEPIESIMYRAGQASVIDYIKSIEDEEI